MCGAGLSAEAGLPTFRGPEGLWRSCRPDELATPEAFEQRPVEVWAWYRWRLERLGAARPHAGHRALAELAGRRPGLVFNQNVDGLLEEVWSAAGLAAERLLALHGSLRRAHCCRCGAALPMERLPVEDLPRCVCGGLLRPSVVWFGEALKGAHLRQLEEEPGRCDAGLAVGSSAQVWPAAGVLEALRRRGRPVIVLNPAAEVAQAGDLHLNLGAAEGLPRLLEDWESRP